MTAGELIAELAKHNPDTPVFVTVEDEFSTSPPVELAVLHRVVDADGPFVELIGAL